MVSLSGVSTIMGRPAMRGSLTSRRKASRPISPFTDVGVAVGVAAEGFLAVVGVDHLQPLETDDLVKEPQGLGVGFGCADVVPGGENVAGVEADGEALRVLDAFYDAGEMLKPAAEIRPLPGRGFQSRADFCAGRLSMNSVEAVNQPGKADLFPRPAVCAGV